MQKLRSDVGPGSYQVEPALESPTYRSYNIRASEAFQTILAETMKVAGANVLSPKGKGAKILGMNQPPSIEYLKSRELVMKIPAPEGLFATPFSPK